MVVLKKYVRGFSGSPVVKTLLALQGAQIRSLVRKLRPPRAVQHGQKIKEKKIFFNFVNKNMYTNSLIFFLMNVG